MHLAYVAIALFLLILLCIGVATIFRRVWVQPGKLRGAALNVFLLGVTTAASLLAAEAFVYQFAVYPDAFVMSLASKRWYAQHWHPINSLGLRGPEPECPPKDGKPVLVVVGDSFTEGAGLVDYHQRFSERMKESIGGRWHVESLGKAGWDTVDEMQALDKFPCQPKRVVLAYFINDIKHAALSHNFPFFGHPLVLPRWGQWFVDHSYLANLAYFRFNHVYNGFFQDVANEPTRKSYADPAIWQTHAGEIEDFIQYCQVRGIALDVVIIPHLYAVAASKEITDKVQREFESLGVPTLNLTSRFMERDPKSLAVSSLDTHPNPATHEEISQAIVEAFKL